MLLRGSHIELGRPVLRLTSRFSHADIKKCTVAYYDRVSFFPPHKKSHTAGYALCCRLNDLDVAAIYDVFTG